MEMPMLKVWGWYDYLIQDQIQRHILAFAVLNRPALLRRYNQLFWKVLIINFLNRISRLALFVKFKASETCSVSFVRYDYDTLSSETLIHNSDCCWRLHALWLPPLTRVPHDRLIVPCLVKKFPRFMETEISLSYSQEPALCCYPEPYKSSPRSHTTSCSILILSHIL
jgi:hypothetical protein